MKLHFTHMSAEDYDEVYALWSNTQGIGLSEADTCENIARYLAKNPGQSFVCKHEERVVGCILCGNDGRRAYIHHTAVMPEYRRTGIARELVSTAMKKQRESGIQKCHLFIFNENEQGKAFWKSVGFEERGDIGLMSKSI